MIRILKSDQVGRLLARKAARLTEAEAMYQRALAGYEKALGPEHESTLDTVHNLGLLRKDQGKLAEAEAMIVGFVDAIEADLFRRAAQHVAQITVHRRG